MIPKRTVKQKHTHRATEVNKTTNEIENVFNNFFFFFYIF